MIITYKFIKELVEEKSGFLDIGLKSREQYMRDCRYTYCRLCFLYVDNFNLTKCGNEINRGHSNVLHAFTVFGKYYGTKSFLANNIFDICNPLLKYIYIDAVSKDTNEKIESLNQLIKSYKSMRVKLIKELNNKL